MEYLYSIEQMRLLERKADAAGHSYAAMMEQAGQGVAVEVIRRAAPRAKVVVMAGPGNNGGDGLVAARVLAEQKFRVAVLVWRRTGDDPLLQAAQQAGASILRDATATEQAGPIFMNCDVGIDALFGTGLTRPITGDMGSALTRLKWARQQGNRPTLLVGVDGPSGLNGDTGKLDPLAVPVDISITFAGPKVGMVATQAVDAIGELLVVDIGIPAAITTQAEKSAEWLSPAWAKSQLPPRPRSGHKGTFGTVMIVGGSQNYAGAPALSALAAGRSGAGYVTLATPEPLYRILAARSDLTTATWLPLAHDFGVLRGEAVKPLHDALARKVHSLGLRCRGGQSTSDSLTG